MPLITAVSDRMIALELGHPIVEGTPQDVISHPRVVESYLGGDPSVINRSGRADAAPAPRRRATAKSSNGSTPTAKKATAKKAAAKKVAATKATAAVPAAESNGSPKRREPLVAGKAT